MGSIGPVMKTESQMTLASSKSITDIPHPTIRNPPWWSRRTRLERMLLLMTATALFVAVILAFVLAIYASNQKPDDTSALTQGQTVMKIQDGDVCLTKGCIKAACNVIQNMDDTAEPCDDFYQFACGGYVEKTFIPDDKTSVSQFSKIDDELKIKLRKLMAEDAKEDEPHPIKMTKVLYKACTDTERIKDLGLTEMKDIIKQLGGWPVVSGDSWDAAGFDWRSSVYKFREMGYSVDWFLDFSVAVDARNSTVRVIDIDQPSLGMSRKYLVKGLEDEDVQAYYNYQVSVAELFGADPERAKKELKESLEFEIKLAEYSLPKEKRRNATQLYNRMTIKELSEMESSIPWLEYFNRLLHPFYTVDENEPVIVNVPSYVKNFSKLITNTEKRIMSNYVIWRVVSSSIKYLTEEPRDLQLNYIKAITGQETRRPRWRECMGVVSGSLSNAIGSLYVRRYFNENAKAAAEEMVSDIRVAFDEILADVPWMDPVTKVRAKAKSKSIATHIAYPKELLDEDKLSELYDGLYLNRSHYLRSMLNLTIFGTNYAFKKLRLPVDKTDWVSHGQAAVVNAFYSPLENSIQFPAGILQGVFFEYNRPKYMNYGGIGFVIGHEITHGFDDQGRQFDKEGNLIDWWEEQTNQEFRKRAQCIIDQYGNYTAEEVGINLNGINTQGENIADNGGIKEAYRGYQSWVKRNKKEQMLPGLPYSPDQMFWLSAANVWCSTYRKEALKLRILTGYHSPARFRVNGPFSNSPDFARAWGCPLSSPMNPDKKCTVW